MVEKIKRLLNDFTLARESLILFAIPATEAEGLYVEIGDIALNAYLVLGRANDGIYKTKVQMKWLSNWGVTEKEVLDVALDNLLKEEPVCGDMFSVILSGGTPIDKEVILNESIPFVVTTKKKINGASVIFHPFVSQRVAQIMGGDYYLSFTSIHEVVIHRKNELTIPELEYALRGTLDAAVPQEEFLTENIYEYSNGKISKVN